MKLNVVVSNICSSFGVHLKLQARSTRRTGIPLKGPSGSCSGNCNIRRNLRLAASCKCFCIRCPRTRVLIAEAILSIFLGDLPGRPPDEIISVPARKPCGSRACADCVIIPVNEVGKTNFYVTIVRVSTNHGAPLREPVRATVAGVLRVDSRAGSGTRMRPRLPVQQGRRPRPLVG